MKNPLVNLPDQAVRLVIVFAVLIGGALIVRAMLPRETTDDALHVKGTVEREMAREPKYAGAGMCGDCHEQSAVKSAGYHRTLSCETCHGAARAHALAPADAKPDAPRKREFCATCHTYHPSRPTGFPQINPAVHNPLEACIACHNPHDPKPPSVPQACEGCHGEIARTKAVSPHARLECTTCHEAPDGHKTAPRAVPASIPKERSFCGTCHAAGAANAKATKVDFATHGEKYLCWQCHYPHMPEAR